MDEITVTNTDIAAVADKLDGMADQFSEQERAALHAVFHMAGAAISESTGDDVQGFGIGGQPNQFSVAMGGTQGILIGLNQAFGAGAVGGMTTSGFGDGSVLKLKGGHEYKW